MLNQNRFPAPSPRYSYDEMPAQAIVTIQGPREPEDYLFLRSPGPIRVVVLTAGRSLVTYQMAFHVDPSWIEAQSQTMAVDSCGLLLVLLDTFSEVVGVRMLSNLQDPDQSSFRSP